ncbi:hypothetical protein Rs2_29127 [Raphanus sativus]|nr:hypothetical protein Rs2_29127 [Raphanus sativus]
MVETGITNSGVKARTGQVRPCNTTRAYGRGPDGQDRHDQPGRAGSDRIAWTGMRKLEVKNDAQPSKYSLRLDWTGMVETGITNSGVKARTEQVRPCNTTRAYGRGPDGQDHHDQPGRAGSDRIAWTGMRKPGVWAGPGCRTGITMPGVKRRECGRGWFSQTGPVRPNSTLGHFKHYFEVLISLIQGAL